MSANARERLGVHSSFIISNVLVWWWDYNANLVVCLQKSTPCKYKCVDQLTPTHTCAVAAKVGGSAFDAILHYFIIVTY